MRTLSFPLFSALFASLRFIWEFFKEVRFLAAIRRTAEQEADSARRERLQAQTWEIPLVDIVFEQPK